MWSLFSRDPSKDFAYELNEVVLHDEKSFWILHDGKKKATSEMVSIFRYECKPNEESYMDLAKNAVKRLKTLRHPSILTYIDSLETDKSILVVTEHVVPLHCHLNSLTNLTQQQKEFSISWGLLSVSKGLGFLNTDCNLFCTNLSLSSIFVNNAGDWRISNFEYLCNIDDSYTYKIYYYHKRYIPPEIVDSNRKLNKNIDSWALACLIWEIFNGFLPDKEKLRNTGKISSKLCPAYNSLIANNFRSRCSVPEFIKKCLNDGGYFKNVFIEAMGFLEEIQIKDAIEKNRFFANLNNRLESFPDDVCKNKIFPLIVTSMDYGDASSNILELLFKIGKMLNEPEYQKKMVPCIIKLFSCKDRSIRSKLLKEIETYVDYIPHGLINDQIFPHLLQGFMDSNPVIREQTVKSIFHISHKLNNQNLNDEIIKHFSRLQFKDPEGGIRTNTIVCLGKIAAHLQPHTRQTVMLPCFMRSLRDPFPPARIAAILSLCATGNFCTLQDCTTKVMPTLCTILMDQEKQVRDHAFTALKSFITKMEKFSDDPSSIEQIESEVNKSGSNVSSKLSSGLSWAVSSLAAKLTRTKVEDEGDNSANNVKRIGNLPSIKTTEKNNHTKKSEEILTLTTKESEKKTPEVTTEETDGWNDNWDDDLLSEISETSSNLKNSYEPKPQETNIANNSWNEEKDDWNGWDNNEPDLIIKPVAKETKAVERANFNRESKPTTTKAIKGPMKLGAQKLRKNN